MMRRLHLIVGLAGVVVFLATGVYMRRNFPDLFAGDETLRYLYRANHVYLALASIANLVLGVYLAIRRPGWRAIASKIGSMLILLSPLLLGYAFVVETRMVSPERPFTIFGSLILLIGALTQLPQLGGGAPGDDAGSQ